MDQLVSQSPVVKRRRRYSPEFKQRLVEASNRSDQSVASVARQHGVNANQLHKWRREFEGSGPANFVRLPETSARCAVSAMVRIELPGGITVHWPVDRMSESVAWLKALLP